MIGYFIYSIVFTIIGIIGALTIYFLSEEYDEETNDAVGFWLLLCWPFTPLGNFFFLIFIVGGFFEWLFKKK